jgi:class 3 adenylate cyclase
VLFADIVGFTELSAKLPPQELVNMLNHYFTAFDYLSAHYEIEKIKTIGDAYMAATGILREDEGALERLAQLSLAMLQEVERLNKAQGLTLQLRIGLHFGPVTAGVIGKQKFIYDLWGDTVNTAARLESHGVPGKVQVSEVVKHRLNAQFSFEEAGLKVLKGKGEVQTYYLTSSK